MYDKDEKSAFSDAETHERAVLAGLVLDHSTSGLEEAERSLNELAELVEAAGGEVVGRATQRRPSRDSATLVGQGKIMEDRKSVV